MCFEIKRCGEAALHRRGCKVEDQTAARLWERTEKSPVISEQKMQRGEQQKASPVQSVLVDTHFCLLCTPDFFICSLLIFTA